MRAGLISIVGGVGHLVLLTGKDHPLQTLRTFTACLIMQVMQELRMDEWQIKPKEIEIMTKPDGSKWLLGSGAFGQVSDCLSCLWRRLMKPSC